MCHAFTLPHFQVKKSMARLKTVLGERQRAHKAALAAQAEADGVPEPEEVCRRVGVVLACRGTVP